MTIDNLFRETRKYYYYYEYNNNIIRVRQCEDPLQTRTSILQLANKSHYYSNYSYRLVSGAILRPLVSEAVRHTLDEFHSTQNIMMYRITDAHFAFLSALAAASREKIVAALRRTTAEQANQDLQRKQNRTLKADHPLFDWLINCVILNHF